ncbi:MAG: HEAT repeat domain-containing protein [Planctomycetota bacterium]
MSPPFHLTNRQLIFSFGPPQLLFLLMLPMVQLSAQEDQPQWKSWNVEHVLPDEPQDRDELVRQLITVLDHHDPHVALYALRRLVIEKPNSAEVAAALTSNIQNRKDYLAPMAPYAWSASLSLGPLEGPAIPVLLAALETEDWFYPAMAVSQLGEKARPAFGWIKEKLDSKSVGQREAALMMISSIGRPAKELAPQLISRLESGEETDRRCKRRLISALGSLGPSSEKAVPTLVSMLWDEREIFGGRVEEIAAEALGQIGDQRAVEPLLRRCAELSPLRAVDLVVALGKLDFEQALPEYDRVLNAEGVRSTLLYRLIFEIAEIDEKAARLLLVELLTEFSEKEISKTGFPITAILEALSKIEPAVTEAAPAAERLLDHKNEEVSIRAAFALGSILGDHHRFLETYRSHLSADRSFEWACRGLVELPKESRKSLDQTTKLIRKLAHTPPSDGDDFPSLEQPLNLLAKLGDVSDTELGPIIDELRNHPDPNVRLQLARIQRASYRANELSTSDPRKTRR